jgi:hypothetical protein
MLYAWSNSMCPRPPKCRVADGSRLPSDSQAQRVLKYTHVPVESAFCNNLQAEFELEKSRIAR